MREMNNLRNQEYFSNRLSKFSDLRKMDKETKRKMMFVAVIVFNLIWIPYAVDDWVNLKLYDSPLVNPNYFSETCYPGDGMISGWEYIFFYCVCPMLSALIFIELIKGWVDDEKTD